MATKMTIRWQRNFTAELDVDRARMAEVFSTTDPDAIAAYLTRHPLELIRLQADELPLTVQVSWQEVT
jgi:hypothetical protein